MDSFTNTGTWRRPSCTAKVCPTMSGMTVERRLQVLMTFFSLAAFIASTFLRRWVSMKGPFFRLRDMFYLPPRAASAATTNNERVGRFGQTRTALGLTPRRDQVTAPGGLAFAPTKGVVD